MDSVDEPLKWRVRVGDGQPAKVMLVFAFAVAAGVLGTVIFKAIWPGLIGFAIIAGSTTEFWLGSRYEIGPEGASSKTGLSLSKISWSDVKRIIVNDAGVTLTPLSVDSRMSAFRGVYVRFGLESRELVLDAIKRFGGSDVPIVDR